MRGWVAGLAMFAGLFGATGVGLAAAGAHIAGGTVVTTAAYFLLFHAGALVALSTAAVVAGRPFGICLAGSIIALGVFLFSGDLALRGLAGIAPVRLAAPAGGIILIAGWLTAGFALAVSFRRSGALR